MVCTPKMKISSSADLNIVVHLLWKGDWIQVNNKNGDIDCKETGTQRIFANLMCQLDVPYDERRQRSFWDHLDASRMAVPR
jgi:hypothetical protein